MTNRELVEHLRRIADIQNVFVGGILALAAQRIEEMGEYCLELGVNYDQPTDETRQV